MIPALEPIPVVPMKMSRSRNRHNQVQKESKSDSRPGIITALNGMAPNNNSTVVSHFLPPLHFLVLFSRCERNDPEAQRECPLSDFCVRSARRTDFAGAPPNRASYNHSQTRARLCMTSSRTGGRIVLFSYAMKGVPWECPTCWAANKVVK